MHEKEPRKKKKRRAPKPRFYVAAKGGTLVAMQSSGGPLTVGELLERLAGVSPESTLFADVDGKGVPRAVLGVVAGRDSTVSFCNIPGPFATLLVSEPIPAPKARR